MLLTPIIVTLALAQAPLHHAELIFPPNPKHNHGSSIVQAPNGDLLACWFHGSGERTADDVIIQGARKRVGEKSWSEPFLMADTPNYPDCNPVLFVDPRGKLWLFWITVQAHEWGSSALKYRVASNYSQDGPPQWEWQDVIHAEPQDLQPMMTSAIDELEAKFGDLLNSQPRYQGLLERLREATADELTRRLGWMTRIHPIMTSDSRMMLGLYSDVFNTSAAAFTDDWGKTWTFSKPIITHELGNIQPAFAQRKNGDIVAYMRDNGLPKKIRTAVSTDGGITWGPVEHLDIPNPGSSVDVVALKNGHWVLVCNDTLDERNVLTAYLSEDEGLTWSYKRALEQWEPRANGYEHGSASYPSLIQTAEGNLHCTYSYKDESFEGSTIRHTTFNEAWIKAAP